MGDDLKERFLKTYANLPLGLRDDIILLLDKKLKDVDVQMKDSVTWRVAYLEIQQNTELSQTILNELGALGLI